MPILPAAVCFYDRMKGSGESSLFLLIMIKMCANPWSLGILAIDRRGKAPIVFEDVGQVALIGEATCERDVSERDIRLSEQVLCALDALAQHKLVRTLASGPVEEASEVIGAEAGLLRQHGQRKVLVEMSENEVTYSTDLALCQPLRWLFDLNGRVCIRAQQMNGEHLSGGPRVEFASGGGLLQLAPERQSNLRQQRVLETSTLDQRQARRITIRHLLDNTRNQRAAQMHMKGLHGFMGEAFPAQFTGDASARLQEEIFLADGEGVPGTMCVPLHQHLPTGEQHKSSVRDNRINPVLDLPWFVISIHRQIIPAGPFAGEKELRDGQLALERVRRWVLENL
jgi:hypothetical protein